MVSPDELESKQVVRFQGGILKLAKLTGTALKRIVGSSEISTTFPYDLPQAWAAALHAHPAKIDGLLYMSKQINDERAVVIFNRATGASLGIGRAVALAAAASGATVVLAARGRAGLEAVATEITAAGGMAEVLPFDAADPGAIRAAVAAAGVLDGLVNTAGSVTQIGRASCRERVL